MKVEDIAAKCVTVAGSGRWSKTFEVKYTDDEVVYFIDRDTRASSDESIVYVLDIDGRSTAKEVTAYVLSNEDLEKLEKE
jgi:hypothetical protein